MARQKQIDTLQQGAKEWNTWRQKYPHTKIDLNGADLNGADLNGADLNGANLSGANLSGAYLNRANLSYTNLGGANLSEANFRGADLNGADLKEANLSRANLSEANLFAAELYRANLSGAQLYRADLSGADLSEAMLYEADLFAANLSKANLSRANLSEAMLYEADLDRAKIGLTTFGNLDLRTVKGLKTIEHIGPSYISTSTLEQSEGNIPDTFLKGVGLSDRLIDYAHSLFSNPLEYYTCFISYSSKDELFAQRLHNDLQQEGVRCWFAPEDMDIGDKIRHRIDESIRLYDKLLLILSEHSINSKWVAYEVERALNKEPQGIPNVLYPVRVDQAVLTCTQIWAKDIKSTRHIGDFEHWTDPQEYDKSFKRLLRALNTRKEQRKS